METFNLLNPEELCHELGRRCRTLRLARNLTQAELAGRTGASLSSIRRLESGGQATLELLARVAQALHMTYQFETLLTLPVITIADAVRQEAAQTRRRARSPRKPRKPPP